VVQGSGGARILIDTPPELRLQLIRAHIDTIDAVLYTHDHADHIHGIDDLRAISIRSGRLPIHGPAETLERLGQSFSYIFDAAVVPQAGTSKPELTPVPVEPGRRLEVNGISVLPFELDHGGTPLFGYRFGELAYLTDVKSVPEASLAVLSGVRVLIVSALFDRPHPTHFSFDDAIDLSSEIGADRTYLTHLTHQFTYAELMERLPDGIEPAYDGLVVPFDGLCVPG
jgi:phosphoribosyl 1,2-cyclic phosphate phosphodiesterase